MICMSQNKEHSPPERWHTYWYDSTLTMVMVTPIFGGLDFIVIGTPRGSLTHATGVNSDL